MRASQSTYATEETEAELKKEWFLVEKSLDLKTQGEYGGHRVIFRTGIGPILKDIRRAQLVNLNIGVGDPIVPAPLKLTIPEMLGGANPSWNIYPIETAIAEKNPGASSYNGKDCIARRESGSLLFY